MPTVLAMASTVRIVATEHQGAHPQLMQLGYRLTALRPYRVGHAIEGQYLLLVAEQHQSFPVRSCMVRMAKSMLSAFWLPSLFQSRHTVVARVRCWVPP